MSQSQPLRIENPDVGSFGTARSINSALWFVNNHPLEKRILGYLAKYREKYNVSIYSFVIMGNHFHLNARFPFLNRAHFYRDLNARTAEAVRALVPEFPGGPLFERRYSEQALPGPEDIEEEFFYCALQSVSSGLCSKISEYPGYNSFQDAISGIKRKFKVVDWASYHAKRRYDPSVPIKDFITEYTLEYDRLPGYEHLSQKEYRELMLRKLEKRRVDLVREYEKEGITFLTRKELQEVGPGTLPHNTKRSERHDPRPLVLSRCAGAKKRYLEWYFSIYWQYKEASKRYLAGEQGVVFPPNTYKPPGLLVRH